LRPLLHMFQVPSKASLSFRSLASASRLSRRLSFFLRRLEPPFLPGPQALFFSLSARGQDSFFILISVVTSGSLSFELQKFAMKMTPLRVPTAPSSPCHQLEHSINVNTPKWLPRFPKSDRNYLFVLFFSCPESSPVPLFMAMSEASPPNGFSFTILAKEPVLSTFVSFVLSSRMREDPLFSATIIPSLRRSEKDPPPSFFFRQSIRSLAKRYMPLFFRARSSPCDDISAPLNPAKLHNFLGRVEGCRVRVISHEFSLPRPSCFPFPYSFFFFKTLLFTRAEFAWIPRLFFPNWTDLSSF